MQVKRFEVHKSKVNDISIDHAVEFIASCSDDGSAAVSTSCLSLLKRDCGRIKARPCLCHSSWCLIIKAL